MKKIATFLLVLLLIVGTVAGCADGRKSENNDTSVSSANTEKTKMICELIPTEINNRNSEGAFITLRDGRLLFAYSHYGAEGFDDGAVADIYAIVSEDDGETFCEPFPFWTHEQAQADNVMSISFLRMNNGDLGMFYLAKRDADQCLLYLIRSTDEGENWSEPVLCSDETGFYVGNNDRVIRTESGRLLFPTALHEVNCEIDEKGNKIVKTLEPGKLIVYGSDDDGFTWRALHAPISIPTSRGCTTGVQEPGVIELTDGRLWCWIRTDSGRQYETFSSDGGETWSTPLPSAFSSAVSPLCMKRLSSGHLLAVWNPVPVYNGISQYHGKVWLAARTPLSYAISRDGGNTFSKPIAIETDPNRGFCYTAIHETKNGILLAYCAGGVEDGDCRNRLRITKLYL